jgi:hypothetical protein
MLTINMKNGSQRIGTTREYLSTPLHLIDSIEISGDELWKVANAPFTPLPFSRRTLEDMLARNGAQQVTSPSSIQLVLDILRGGERRPQAPPEGWETADQQLDIIYGHVRDAFDHLEYARDMLAAFKPSAILEACQKLAAKGYSVERILGILDAEGRPELDKTLQEIQQNGDYTP